MTTTTAVSPRDETRAGPTWRRASALAPALVAAAYLAYAVWAGLPAVAVVRASASVVVTQIVPGMLLWRTARPRNGSWFEDIAMGFAIGAVLAVGAQVAAALAGVSALSVAIPLGAALLILAVPGSRRRVLSAETTPLPWWWGPSVGAVALFSAPQTAGYFQQLPLTWPSGYRAPHVDAYLHLALAGELAHRGPLHFPWVLSEPLGYHWFAHAWVAQVGVSSHTSLDGVLFRFMPAIMPIALVLAVAAAAVRLTGKTWTGPLAAVLTLVGGDVNYFGKLTPGFPIAPLSPTLSLAAPILVCVVVLLCLRWRGELLPGGLLLLPLLCVGVTGTKGSTGPLLVMGLAAALGAMLLFNRGRVRTVAIDLAIMVGSLIFAILFVFRGSGEGLHLNLVDAAGQTPGNTWLGGMDTGPGQALVIALVVFGVFGRGLLTLALLFSRKGRRNPLTWLLLGGGFTGAAAVGVFAHPGLSQYYFARSAGPLLALGSTLGIVAVVDRFGRRLLRPVLVGVVAGLLSALLPAFVLGPMEPVGAHVAYARLGIALAVVVIALLVSSSPSDRMRVAAVTVGVSVLAAGVTVAIGATLAPLPGPAKAVTARWPLATSPGQIRAARWIRHHSRPDDLVMTNRHCVTPKDPTQHCDSRHWVVTAFSERQVLVEGWTATPMAAKLGPNGRDSVTVNYWHPDLLALNDGFIAHPTASAALELRKMGVRWVYVDHSRPYAVTLVPYATLRFHTSGVDVYELT